MHAPPRQGTARARPARLRSEQAQAQISGSASQATSTTTTTSAASTTSATSTTASATQYLHGKWKLTNHESYTAGVPSPLVVNTMLSVDENLGIFFEDFQSALDGICHYTGSVDAPIDITYGTVGAAVVDGAFKHDSAGQTLGTDGVPLDCHAATAIGIWVLSAEGSPFADPGVDFEVDISVSPHQLTITTQGVPDMATGIYSRLIYTKESDTPDVRD